MAFDKANLRIEAARCYLATLGAEHRDDPAYLGWLRDPEVVRTLYLPSYLESQVRYEEVKTYCDRMMESDVDLFMAIHDRETGKFIGTIKAGHTNWYSMTTDIGIMIGDKSFWRKGLAQDAILHLCRYLFDTVGMRKLTSGSMAINLAMMRVFEKLGFKQEACIRNQDRIGDEYCDHVHFGCFADELVRAGT